MSDYKKLAAIVESTQRGQFKRASPLELEIGGTDNDLILRVVQRGPNAKTGKRERRILATAPFSPGQQDQAARDVARQLTLDGDLPTGMDS